MSELERNYGIKPEKKNLVDDGLGELENLQLLRSLQKNPRQTNEPDVRTQNDIEKLKSELNPTGNSVPKAPVIEIKKTEGAVFNKPKHEEKKESTLGRYIRRFWKNFLVGGGIGAAVVYSENKHRAPTADDINPKRDFVKEFKFKGNLTPKQVLHRQVAIDQHLDDSSDFKNDALKDNGLYFANRDRMKSESDINNYNYYDDQKLWLQNVVQSNEYLDRLTEEFSGDRAKAEAEQKRRINALAQDYVLEDLSKIKHDAGKNTLAYYAGTTHLPRNDGDQTTAIHESEHQITDGDNLITSYAKNLYKEGFSLKKAKLTENLIRNNDKKIWESYLSDPTEIDARKKELEFEMDKMLIKKYGEKFTEKHYKALKKLEKDGFLGERPAQFLKIIKHKDLIKIMNTIAANTHEVKDTENWS